MKSKTFGDKEVFYQESTDPVIQNLEQGHLYGEPNRRLLMKFVYSLGTIVDCGAHVGTFSFNGALSGQDYILIEGAKGNYECLEKTFKDFPNVKVVNKILMSKTEKCSFSTESGPFGNGFYDENSEEYSSTLDEILDGVNIAGIKLDIEGNEVEALAGGVNVISKYKPPMLVEVNGHCLRLQKKLPMHLFEKIESLGYTCFIPISQEGRTVFVEVDSGAKFPFCVMDVICLHKDNIHRYPDFTFMAPLPSNVSEEIIAKNYDNSNCDCQAYFDSIKNFA